MISDHVLFWSQIVSLFCIVPIGFLVLSYMNLTWLFFIPMIPAVTTFYMMCRRCDWSGFLGTPVAKGNEGSK